MMLTLNFALVIVGLAARGVVGGDGVPFDPSLIGVAGESEHVAFHAKADNTATYNAGDTVIFNSVLINDGNEYDPSTGVFKSSSSGNYVFSFTLRVSRPTDSPRKLELFSPARNEVIATAVSTESSSAFVIVNLNYGDELMVRNGVDGSTFDAGATFSGFNLH